VFLKHFVFVFVAAGLPRLDHFCIESLCRLRFFIFWPRGTTSRQALAKVGYVPEQSESSHHRPPLSSSRTGS
jgi:hypothetical protein